MAKSRSELPNYMRESQGDEYYCGGGSENENFAKQQQKVVKIVAEIGHRAGISKSNFDTSLDENSQKWFDRIFQYWKQCKLKMSKIKDPAD